LWSSEASFKYNSKREWHPVEREVKQKRGGKDGDGEVTIIATEAASADKSWTGQNFNQSVAPNIEIKDPTTLSGQISGYEANTFDRHGYEN